MKKIELSKGKFATIDDGDFEKVNQYKWYCSHYGYAVRTERTSEKVIMHWMHRFILDDVDDFEVDHINGDRLDNRKSNLRKCNRNQNCKNTTLPITNTSGYKGVAWHKQRGKWRAFIMLNHKQISLGLYDDKEEAYKVRLECENELMSKLLEEYADSNRITDNIRFIIDKIL